MKRQQKGGTMKQRLNAYRSGAVSIFVVIFTAVLLTGVTVGFTVLMLSDQERSTDNDLSQSARDSAEAGVEDAKRVLAQLTDCQDRGLIGQTTTDEGRRCGEINNAINAKNCDTISRALGVTGEKERKVAQSEGDNKLDQAYTCVTIDPDTDAFVGKTEDESDMRVIPLRGTDTFDTVELSWIDRSDVPERVNFEQASGDTPSDSRDRAAYIPLPTRSNWQNRGSILRVGTILYNPNDVNVKAMDNAARTAFLYAGTSSTPRQNIDLTDGSIDVHKSIYNDPVENEGVPDAVNTATPVHCSGVAPGEGEPTKDGYLCKTSVKVKDINDASEAQLTLSSLYRATSFSIVLKDSTNPEKNIKFRGVQPEVDSTGRANDVFRRVVARVEAVGGRDAPFPRAAVGTSGSICKSYIVTDNPADYREDAAAQESGSGCYNLQTGDAY